jgi:hypothetical protein
VPATAEERERTLELVNDELQKRLEMQFSAADRVDTKATLLLGFVATAGQFVLTRAHRSGWAIALALLGYGLAFAAGLSTVALRSYRAVPHPPWIISEYAAQLRAQTDGIRRTILGKLVAAREKAFEHNEKIDKWKAKAWWISLGGLAVGVVFSVVSLSIGSTSHERGPAHPGAHTRGHHRHP